MPNARSIGDRRRGRSSLIKQACDACKLRKVKCIYDDSIQPGASRHPCQRCLRLTIQCNFTLPQKCRGPRKRRRDVRYVTQYLSDIGMSVLKALQQEQHANCAYGAIVNNIAKRHLVDGHNIAISNADYVDVPACKSRCLATGNGNLIERAYVVWKRLQPLEQWTKCSHQCIVPNHTSIS